MRTKVKSTTPDDRRPLPPALNSTTTAPGFTDNRAAGLRQRQLAAALDTSPALQRQRHLAMQLAGAAPIQRAISIAKESYDADAVATMIRARFVVEPPLALDQVLTGYDFGKRRFADLEALVDAVDKDLDEYAFSHRRVGEGVAEGEEVEAEAEEVSGYYHAAAGGSGYAPLGAEEDARVARFKHRGRKSKYAAGKVSATRRAEVAASGKSMAKTGVFIGLDAALPGLGSGLSGANAANEVRKKHKVGKGKKELAKSAVVEGSAQALPYIAFARDLGSVMKSTFQSSKGRKQAKVARARKVLEQIEEQLPQAEATLADILSHADASDADNIRRLRKAIERMEAARAEIIAWIKTKKRHGTLPLTSGLEEYGADEE